MKSTTVVINFNKIITTSFEITNALGCGVTRSIAPDNTKLTLTLTGTAQNNKNYTFSVTDIDGIVSQFRINYRTSNPRWRNLTKLS